MATLAPPGVAPVGTSRTASREPREVGKGHPATPPCEGVPALQCREHPAIPRERKSRLRCPRNSRRVTWFRGWEKLKPGAFPKPGTAIPIQARWENRELFHAGSQLTPGAFPFSRQDNMEPFSLSELGLPAENKAIQGILCPMAVELCHLLLALEREDGICPAFPSLGEKAEELAKAMEELAAVARR